MNREKHIREMSDLIYENRPIKDIWNEEADSIAETLYNAGYRKQSEVIEEYRKKVYSKMEKYTVFGREYIQRIMREAEKEMKGGAE